MDSPLEQFQEATLRLAQAGTVKERLADAFLQHLSFLDAQQVPETCRREFIAMCEAMLRERPLPRENPVRASIRKMSNEEANGYAALIVRIFGAAARTAPAAQNVPARSPALSLAPLVQLFAAEG